MTLAVPLKVLVFLRKPAHERGYQSGQPVYFLCYNHFLLFCVFLFYLAMLREVFVFLRKPPHERGYQSGQPRYFP